jgi:hypothetical protein
LDRVLPLLKSELIPGIALKVGGVEGELVGQRPIRAREVLEGVKRVIPGSDVGREKLLPALYSLLNGLIA